METSEIAGYVVLVLCVLVALRLRITQGMHMRALDAVHVRAQQIIMDQARNMDCSDGPNFMTEYVQLGTHNFSLDVLDLRKWTYTQYFPDIPEEPRRG